MIHEFHIINKYLFILGNKTQFSYSYLFPFDQYSILPFLEDISQWVFKSPICFIRLLSLTDIIRSNGNAENSSDTVWFFTIKN